MFQQQTSVLVLLLFFFFFFSFLFSRRSLFCCRQRGSRKCIQKGKRRKKIKSTNVRSIRFFFLQKSALQNPFIQQYSEKSHDRFEKEKPGSGETSSGQRGTRKKRAFFFSRFLSRMHEGWRKEKTRAKKTSRDRRPGWRAGFRRGAFVGRPPWGPVRGATFWCRSCGGACSTPTTASAGRRHRPCCLRRTRRR